MGNCLEMPPKYNVVLAVSELCNTVCTVEGGAKISQDGWYDTTIIDTTDTDTSSCSIDTWFLATPIRYLAHEMYFGVPGTSVPSERFSKAGEVIAATRYPRMWTWSSF